METPKLRGFWVLAAGLALATAACDGGDGGGAAPDVTGATDTGAIADAADAEDDAPSDTAAPDTAAPDAAAPDAAEPDTVAPDTVAPDTAAPDTAVPDTAAPDTAPPDTAEPDTAVPDTAVPDTAAPDTTAPDTTAPDTAPPDDAAVDAGAPDAGPSQQVPAAEAQLLPWLQAGNYKAFAAESKVHGSLGPHGAVKVFLNDVLFASLTAGNASHPQGAAAVKELYEADMTTLTGWAVSVKVDAESKGGDGWYWYEVYTLQGGSKFADGKGVPLCKNCHVAGKDMVLIGFPLQ